MRPLLWIVLFGILPGMSIAQKEKRVCADYTYIASGNLSIDEAKKIALDRARLKAIADEFGTLMAQSNATMTKNEDGNSEINFSSFGWSEVKGEWIENIGEPEYHISYENDMLVVKVSVCGKAREIIREKVDISVKILRNGTEQRYESNCFKNGDDLYVLFQTPRKGFVAVYLIDQEENAWCLLPYRNDLRGIMEVAPNREYVFFSKKRPEGIPATTVDEYTLTTSRSEEVNMLYILYSPNEFTKANDQGGNTESLPRELSFGDFQKWKTRNMQRDPKMQIIEKQITIQKQ